MLSLYESEELMKYRMRELERELKHGQLMERALSAGGAPGASSVRERLLIWVGGRLVATGKYLQVRGGLTGVPATPSAITMHTLLITCLSNSRMVQSMDSPASHLNAPAGGVERERLGVRQPAA